MSQAMHLLTVCIPMNARGREGQLLAEETNAELKKLGNPAPESVRERFEIRDDGKPHQRIHFMSVSALSPTRDDEHATLIIEATGDGGELAVTSEIDRAIGDLLFPILARGCGVKSREDVKDTLRRHTNSLTRNIPFGTRITGLQFAGIGDFTVQEILGHAEIAEIARTTIYAEEDERKETEQKSQQRGKVRQIRIRPFDLLDKVRAEVAASGHSYLVENAKGRKSPSYVDQPDSPWIRKAIRKLRRTRVRLALGGLTDTLFALPRTVLLMIPVLAILGIATYLAAHTPIVKLIETLGFQEALAHVFSDKLLNSKEFWRFVAIGIIAIFVGILAALTTTAVLFGGLVLGLRKKEEQNTPDDSDPDPDLVAALLATENPPNRPGKGQWVQNHMIAVSELQPGIFRRLIVLPFAMRIIIKQLTSATSRKGFLTDMGVVHFARWIVPPGSRKLVFFSNYDGSWESYFEDFIIKAADGVTAIWGNSKGFPKVRYLVNDGAADGDRFKRFSRRAMVVTPFWYAAYPEISAEQVRKNGLLVHGLANIETLSEAEAWLEMFASMPRPEFAVEKGEIQNIAFGGNVHLPESRVYALRFGDLPDADPAASAQEQEEARRAAYRRWIYRILPGLTFGEMKRADFTLYLGLSMSGLRKLGLHANLDDEHGVPDPSKIVVDGLPAAFVQGMNHPGRNRVLRDPDPASQQWEWGGDANPVDAVLLAYWQGDDPREYLESVTIPALQGFGITVAKQIETWVDFYQPPESDGASDAASGPRLVSEPFGFADGVSQPKIRYLSAGSASADSVHLVEAGEFILGYRDNLGYLPPTPTICADDDCNRRLASLPSDLPLRWPAFGRADQSCAAEVEKYERRDFGRNGSFLVIRQLKQDVKGFNEFAEANAPNRSRSASVTHGGAEAYPDVEWVKAKMVGRWKNGSSLVHHPEGPGRITSKADLERDNEFLFGEDDPQGVHCPLGAHIRRANPRDSLNPKKENQLDVSNRHRLLRRGRTFGTKDRKSKTSEGTMFMCLNADIERQFEFIQQTWLNGEAFHGLSRERDPIAASAEGPFDYSVPSESVADRFTGMSSFVKMQGGGYFFLPSYRALEFLALEPEANLCCDDDEGSQTPS